MNQLSWAFVPDQTTLSLKSDAVHRVSRYRIWDPTQARFEQQVLPYLSAIPALFAVVIFLGLVIRPLLPTRPRWMQPFVKEVVKIEDEQVVPSSKKRPIHSLIVLLVASTLGLALQTITLFGPSTDFPASLLAASWAVTILMITISRPKTAPTSLLTIYGVILVIQCILLVEKRSKLSSSDVPLVLQLSTATLAITTILRMPLRDPRLATDKICPVFDPPTYDLYSPEDNLTLWQFMTVSWMSPLISLGKIRQLNDQDVWFLGFEFHHSVLHDTFKELQGTVVRRLLWANGVDLVIISTLAILELVANFSIPVLLQQLLQSIEDPRAPLRAAVTYASFSLVVRLIASQSGVFTLWYSRRCYERSRGEMITMLYEKTLSRKIIGLRQKPIEVSGIENNGSVVGHTAFVANRPNGILEKVYEVLKAPIRLRNKILIGTKTSNQVKEPASMGKILNLMRNDVYEVAQRFWEFPSLITKPLGLVFSIVLVWRLMGWSCFIGVLAVIMAQIANAFIIRVLLRWERTRRRITDSKLQVVSQFVSAIRHLRWYSWQNAWLDQIMDKRQQELNLRIITSIWGMLIAFTNNLASGLFPVAAFYAYTTWAGQQLRIDIAFPALQLFIMLETSIREIPGLITVLLNASVAVGRIEDFMSEPDKAETDGSASSEQQLQVNDASFAWPGHSQAVLVDINVAFPLGLTIIRGKVSAGKTALLLAMLGELDLLSGTVNRLDETVGYCAQTPWLQSMSIKDNILFHYPYDEARYRQVLEVCALLPDLANFKDGDSSMIGENGIGLSGGQKARVALARAIYSRAKLLVLDDPLSALDHQTAEFIVDRCLGGPLMKERTIILVTHRHELCKHIADQMIEIDKGKARIVDRDTTSSTGPALEPLPKQPDHDTTPQKYQENDAQADSPDKFIEGEHRAHGGVQALVYWEYIKAGKLRWWLILICGLAVYRVVSTGRSWFLKSWGEAYGEVQEQGIPDPFSSLPSPERNIQPWLLGFLLIAIAQSIIYLFSATVMMVIIYSAGRQMFKDIMTHVAYATFRFYDVTPIGRLMNRLTSDITTIDGNISQQFQNVAFTSITWISSIVVIASVTPMFLVFSLVLTAAFVLIFLQFLPTSQSLRRLEMVSLSPLMSNFGALLDGLTTVRAFCAQHRFQNGVINVTDAFQKMDHFYWSLQAWLMYRFDSLSACSTFILTMLALYTGVSPGLVAFVLVSAEQFVTSTHSLCKQYGQLQMDFVSVERVVELLHLDQEPPGPIDPPAAWPTYAGDIVFENVTMRYAPHLDPVLLDLSFKIKGGTNTAVVGRTGSGKSTLAMALLATISPDSGRIIIDGIDVSEVNKQSLRSRVTFLAQDPVLFPGTLRQNLDPLEEHSDEDCQSVLGKINAGHRWTLGMQIDTGGRNLSQGERQLVNLARAILRRSPIVILDEATASIDMETAMHIQQVLRDEMKDSTVITIAHRVEAVKNADYFIRLAKGRLIAEGPASAGM